MKSKYNQLSGLSRREFLRYGLYGGVAAGLSNSLFLGGCGIFFGGAKRPNVLLIVLDTARADRFSFMGYPRNTSGAIDRIASQGAVYKRAYTTDFWTLPSHASLFTGLYPSQAQATSETNQLPAFNTTIAQILAGAGYDTAAFVCNPWVGKERGFSKGFNEFYEMWRSENSGQTARTRGKLEWAALEKVLFWLEQQNNKANPFFTFINLNCAHMPYYSPEPFFSDFIKSGYKNEEILRIVKIAGPWEYLGGEFKLSERDFRIMGDLYDGEIAFADYCVGEIVSNLNSLGVLDNTVVIITSDHGENLGEHGLIDHTLSMYETTLRIPLVIRYPRSFKGGAEVNDLVSLIDVVPTILDLCGIDYSASQLKFSGVSLARKDRVRRSFVVAENERPLNGINLMKSRYAEFDTSSIDYRMRAIRTDSHKFIWKIGGSRELYELRVDPGELNNLADKDLETTERLNKIVKLWMKGIPAAKDISLLKSQDAESLEILRSLGYIK